MDGFVFKRKRTQPESQSAPAASEQSAAKKPRLPNTSPQPAATPSLHPTAGTPAASKQQLVPVVLPGHIAAVTPAATLSVTPIARSTATPAGATAATAALLQQLPADAAEPDRLASLCELLCAAQIDELNSAHAPEDAAAVEAVKAVLASFAVSVRAAAAQGTFEASAASSLANVTAAP